MSVRAKRSNTFGPAKLRSGTIRLPLDITNKQGVVYEFGTNGRAQTFANPAQSIINTSLSTTYSGVVTAINATDRGAVTDSSHTNNIANSWFKIDLGNGRSLIPEHLMIQQRTDSNLTLYGALEVWGSNDDTNWSSLGTIASPTQAQSAWNTIAIPSVTAYRYFRVNMTGTSNNLNNYFVFGEIELFGTLQGFTSVTAPAFETQMLTIPWSLWWKMNETSGTTAIDSSGNGRNGTYNHAVRLPTPGGFGQILNGSSTQFASIADAAWMDADTFSVMIAFATNLNSASNSMCGRFNQSVTTNNCWAIDHGGASATCRGYVTNTSNVSATVTSTSTVADGVKHLAILTYDSANLVTLYIDGVSVGTPATLSGTENNASSAEGLWVGKRASIDSALFSGAIGHFAYIAGTVLTPVQILDLYNSFK